MSLPESLSGALRLPIIGAPMFIVSVPDLVVAQCTAGIVGSFPALNARPQERLEEWIVDIKARLAAYADAHPGAPVAPFAVNQIVHGSNTRLQADLETCVRHEVPIIITSLRPPGEVVAGDAQRRELPTQVVAATADNGCRTTRCHRPWRNW